MALNSNALTTLVMAKAFLKVPSGDLTQDSIIELCINTSSQYLEGATDRKLKSQSFTELRHGSNNNIILLRNYPVTSITELAIDNSSQFTDPNTILSNDNYVICDDSNSILYIKSLFPSGYNNIRIKYVAGYIDVPTDLEMACLWLVHFYYRIRETQDIGRTTKSKMDESISILQEAPKDVKDTIARYRRFEMPSIDSPIMNG